jgi:hypothetical protein
VPEARRTLVTLGLAAAGVAVAGYLVTQGWGPVGESGASATAPATSTTTPLISPPPENPADVATDTAVPTLAALQITYAGPDDAAGGIAVGAYVAGLIEEGGRCALTLSKEGESAGAESEALADASTTSCGQLLVPFSELEPGTWTAEVTYTSPTGRAVAAGQTEVVVA